MKPKDRVFNRRRSQLGTVLSVKDDCGDKLVVVKWDADRSLPPDTLGGSGNWTTTCSESSLDVVEFARVS